MRATIKLWGILMITTLDLLLLKSSEAVLHVPIGFTRPAGLQSVNGSDPFGGCPQTPQNCSVMPSGVHVCQCPGDIPATGVLINGVIPTIVPLSNMNWANGLFTVNRNGQNSVMIGFNFASAFNLRGVEMKLFNCPVWNIAASTINVYGSLVFPTFFASPSTPIGTVDILKNQNCESLTTVTIPVQPPSSVRAMYFIEFTFNNDPSIEWAPSIAEIQFSDETPTQPPATEMTTMSTTLSPDTSTTDTELFTTDDTTTPLSTTPPDTSSSPTTTSTFAATTSPTNTTVDTDSTTESPTTIMDRTTSSDSTTESPTTIMDRTTSSDSTTESPTTITDQITSADSTTESPTTITDQTTSAEPQNQTQTIIGVLVAIIVILLVLLVVVVIAILGCVVLRNRYNKQKLEVRQLQNATLEPPKGAMRFSTIKETDTAVNQHYEFLGKSGYSAISTAKEDNELYSEIRDTRTGSRDALNTIGNETYEGIDHDTDHTDKPLKPEPTYEETTDALHQYSEINKPFSPPVPPKTPELYRELKTQTENGLVEATDPPLVNVSDYSDVGADATEKDYYSEIASGNALPKSPSGLVPLSKSLCEDMDVNPDYESSGSAGVFACMANPAKAGGSEEIYTNPDSRFSQSEEIFNTIYSEPIKPSLFDPQDLDHEENESDDIQPYAPIYSLISIPDPNDKPPLNVKYDNIEELQELGTGFFGNVLLAQTIGLSRKDLGLSDSDNNNSVAIQVAVKLLKKNASEKTQKAFEKEHKFMARLSHPNVVRMLAVCTDEDTPFIMMEYMENGDLNQYLQKFDSISKASTHNESEIHTSTLAHMASQVANAMKYLTSKNYIHRDIATRNCLVGQNFLVKLGDFGMSRNLYESHYYILQGRAILPIRWMASECFYGKFSSKSDVWAFGITVWEIFTLAKQSPYSQMTDHEVTQDAIKMEDRTLLEKPTDCPEEVYKIIFKCWAADPKERATFEELYEDFLSLNSSNSDDNC